MALRPNLTLVQECDNFPYYHDDPEFYSQRIHDYYYQFHVKGCDATLGYIPAKIVDLMPWTEDWSVEKDSKRVTFAFREATGDAEKDCSTALAQFLKEVREKKVFGVLDGWRNELYPIYGPNRKLLFSMERSATLLFGVVTYGVHMTAFVRTLDGMKLWIPHRAKTKQTYPGMMDNTVAGGLTIGEQPFECLVREAAEEASLPEHVTRKARPCGTLTYFQTSDARAGGETGLCQPECQYLYDLELPLDVIPTPCDNEAVDFRLLSIEEVQKAIGKGEFKPNCALVVLEFLVRHGILTAENEPDYVEIVARLHRRLEFPTA